MVRRHVNAIGMDACYVNMCGAQDEIVFDGETFACSADEVLARAPPVSYTHLSGFNFFNEQTVSSDLGERDIQNFVAFGS